MSVNFALKDMLHFGSQTKAYFKATILMVALTILFLNITKSLGLFNISSTIQVFTYTIYDLFNQFNQFLVILTFSLTLLIFLSQNHAIVLHRKKDISIMQALGTNPRNLYSYYITEILICSGLAFVLGWALGFGCYLFVVIIYLDQLSTFTFQFDFLWSIMLGFLIIGCTYALNGWEIRKIGRSSYAQTKGGNLDANVKGLINPKVRSFFNNHSISLKFAVQNLTRKVGQTRQLVSVIAIASTIILLGFVGINVINHSTSSYVRNAQGEHVYAIGYENITRSFSSGYEKFRNPEVAALQQEDFLKSQYNLTSIITPLQSIMQSYQVSKIESRIYLVEKVIVGKGYYLNDSNELVEYLGNVGNTTVVPIQAIDFENSIQKWYTVTNEDEYLHSGVTIGDTLSLELFETAYYESLSFRKSAINLTLSYNIFQGVVDPFNNGNSIYMNLSTFQTETNFGNYNNLLLIDFTPAFLAGKGAEFVTQMNQWIATNLGDQYEGIDLSSSFEANINSIQTIQMTTLELAIIMAIIILIAVYEFEKARIEDDEKDLFIIKACGAPTKSIRNMILIEQIIVIIFGLSIGLMISMAIMIFVFLENVILPDVMVPLLYCLGTLIVFILMAAINSQNLSKKYYTNGLLDSIRTIG